MQTSEKFYTVYEVAEAWKLSHDFVRRLFRNEQGVLLFERPARRFKRTYSTLRIPQSVMDRVQTRLSIAT